MMFERKGETTPFAAAKPSGNAPTTRAPVSALSPALLKRFDPFPSLKPATAPSAAASAAEVAVRPSNPGADDSKRPVVRPAFARPPPATSPSSNSVAILNATVSRRESINIWSFLAFRVFSVLRPNLQVDASPLFLNHDLIGLPSFVTCRLLSQRRLRIRFVR